MLVREGSVLKVLVASLGGKEESRDEKQKPVLSPEEQTHTLLSPGLSKGNSYLGRAVPNLKSFCFV